MSQTRHHYWNLGQLAALLSEPGSPAAQVADATTTLQTITTDSRRDCPGSLFIALPGVRFDGRDFIEQAIVNGAVAVVLEEGFARLEALRQRYPDVFFLPVKDALTALAVLARARLQQVAPLVIAVTGSNGKTTTKEMLAQLLQDRFRVHKTAGNFNNRIGLPLTVFAMPDDCQVVVLEMGMNEPGEIAALGAVAQPDYAVLTNVAAAHLQGLGSLEAVARAKCELIGQIKSGGAVIYNADDPYLARMVPLAVSQRLPDKITLVPVSAHGAYAAANAAADLVGVAEIWLTGAGLSFVLLADAQKVTIKLPCWGRHNVMNAALAAAAALQLPEVSLLSVAQSLENFKNLDGRLQCHQLGNGPGVLVHDAYNANPASMQAALTAVSERREKRFLALVLGDMLEIGSESALWHQRIGRRVAEIRPDLLLLLGRAVEELAAGARAAGLPAQRIILFPAGAQAQAAALLQERLPADALVLLKGSHALALEKLVEPLLNYFKAV
ncbi:MAG: UDP-N-acetylmuramoyl-tripeptide--D-alanyl-D-alanine ligase [Deltaproteobacteria bacterium]|nr:UDP-N-acetylmuramoyl-tripeptide--D-alanyl-D-alanine ligase [Deltaproteobacteria bacterium]